MTKSTEEPNRLSQLDEFKKTARELGADEDENRWDQRLKKVAKVKPVEKPSPGA